MPGESSRSGRDPEAKAKPKNGGKNRKRRGEKTEKEESASRSMEPLGSSNVMLRRLECQVRALEAGATPKRKQSQKMAETRPGIFLIPAEEGKVESGRFKCKLGPG